MGLANHQVELERQPTLSPILQRIDTLALGGHLFQEFLLFSSTSLTSSSVLVPIDWPDRTGHVRRKIK